jgi:hypothetical protein
MKEIFFVARDIVSALLYPYKSNKTNDKKSELFTKIMDVYSYRRTHRRALCGAGVLCRYYGVVTCNTVGIMG